MKTFTVVLAAMLAAATPGLAQDAGLTDGDLATLDTSGEGVLTMDEFTAYMNAAFARMDGNSDGNLSSEEALIVITPEHLAAADADGDQRLTKAEFDAQIARDFSAADLDADGSLD